MTGLAYFIEAATESARRTGPYARGRPVRKEDRMRQLGGQRVQNPTSERKTTWILGLSLNLARISRLMGPPSLLGPYKRTKPITTLVLLPDDFGRGSEWLIKQPSSSRTRISSPILSHELKHDSPVFSHTFNGQPSRSCYSTVFDAPHRQIPPPIYDWPSTDRRAATRRFVLAYAIHRRLGRLFHRASTSPAVSSPEVPPAFAQEIDLGRGSEAPEFILAND